MRIRKCLALGGAITVFLGCLIIYRIADYTFYLQEESVHHANSIRMPPGNKFMFNENSGLNKVQIVKNKLQQSKLKKTCSSVDYYLDADIEMSDVYMQVKFDNIDGGVWKQGWNIQINPTRWSTNNKLKVFIVPHSHNDPGWLKTFEDYYTSETRSILNNMLKKLIQDPNKKFIWAEISFFSLWWDELSEEDHIKVRRLIQRGQLELVTGGWVMNDEANTHYYSMLTQLTEGHQWMKVNVQMEPKNGWTIDPFGESPVMPYLLKKMGLNNLVIQRVHYSVKKYFAEMKYLEFRWRQFWDKDSSNEVLTHMTPFYSYDVPHTCGPDPKICCQFDFRRLPGNGLSCPWKESPKIITKNNVAIRAQMLLDQYRKKAELYRSNVILVPLGDDFRYQYPSEWDNQFENYYKLLAFINSNSDFHAEVKFGTLSDFFKALTAESNPENFPTLTGDFFTYADRDDHYWSGYYTSRPFYKRMDRILIGYHRAAEILFSLGWSSRSSRDPTWLLSPQTGFAKMLRDARRSLSLFQHHDGVTGTARNNVMEDYAQKMIDSINYSKHIIQQISHFLLSRTIKPYLVNPEQIYFEFDDQKRYLDDVMQRKVIDFTESNIRTIVFFNSLAHQRKELVAVYVSTPFVEVLDSDGNEIQCQTNPVFIQHEVMDEARYEVIFMADAPALGLTSYKITMKEPEEKIQTNVFSKVTVFNSKGPIKYSKGFENIITDTGREFSIENQRISIALSDKGLLKSLTNKETMVFTPLHLDFVGYSLYEDVKLLRLRQFVPHILGFRYRAREGKEMSGAYLFLPNGEATILVQERPLIRVYEGPLITRVEVKLRHVVHFLILQNTSGSNNLGIEIINFVDILKENNFELAMRLTSHVESATAFFTDLNGFQMIQRTRFHKLPIQGNFYPMPSAAYIEDDKTRITILTGQPLGVSSLRQGELEVLQDRRLVQDDNRGLGQGVLDNRVTPNLFRILVERRLENCNKVSSSLSVNAYKLSQSLLNPLIKMISTSEVQRDLLGSYSPVSKDMGNDIHLVSARTFDEEEINPRAGLVFHRTLLDQCFFSSPPLSNGVINIHSFLPNNFGEDMTNNTLSFLREEQKLRKREDLMLCPMDFLALMLS
ncbi:hypothetical protein RUM43_008025 [Polyplax serrata]|uniref:Alpha-mannosidase n=1 Tax=Polyplax serrata TaxID=468196 RepID=A0AAN8S5X1_POLSC